MNNVSTGNTSQINQTDWERIREMQDYEIIFDTDSPHTTLIDWNNAIMKYNGREIGKVNESQTISNKILLTVHYSPEVVEYFRAIGNDWEMCMDTALKEWIATHAV